MLPFCPRRLYPVIPGNARVIPDRDIHVGEYIIPKKVSRAWPSQGGGGMWKGVGGSPYPQGTG